MASPKAQKLKLSFIHNSVPDVRTTTCYWAPNPATQAAARADATGLHSTLLSCPFLLDGHEQLLL
jgi:hypothetical protein